MDSTFKLDSVKDDLFIREDVISKYNIPDITTSTTTTSTTTTTSGNKTEL